jgi:hypothetical protein
VQRPDDAEVSLMVEAALKHAPVDFMLSLTEIAGLLRGVRPVEGRPS